MNRFLTLIVALLGGLAIQAQSIVDLYVDPDFAMEYTLTVNQRREQMQKALNGVYDTLRTASGVEAWIERLDTAAQLLVVHQTLNSTQQIKLVRLPQDRYVILAIETTCAPACASTIWLYSLKWRPVCLLAMPGQDYDFFTFPADMVDSEHASQIRQNGRPRFIQADLIGSDTIRFTCHLPLLDRDQRLEVEKYIHPIDFKINDFVMQMTRQEADRQKRE